MKRIHILIAVVAFIILVIFFINSKSAIYDNVVGVEKVNPRILSEEKSKTYELAKEITSPDGFINTDGLPVAIKELIGKKIILVDFWTYSCINCQRTTPYLNSWYGKYKDKGFVILGIHTPEFEFEKNYDNVKKAVEKFEIKYPVILDNDYSTWTAYGNRYWPRKYLIDIDGYIVYDHIGEGAYEETEKKIQEALNEKMAVLEESGQVDSQLTKETSARGYSISPETYFGANRNELFSNGTKGVVGTQNNLIIPNEIGQSRLYLAGDWSIQGEFAQNISNGAGITYKYNAKDVFLVAQAESETIIEVLVDGRPILAGVGEDVIKTADGKTILKIKEAQLYRIIQGNAVENHILELIIQEPELRAFTFTFG